MNTDYSLYLVTDRKLAENKLLKVVESAIKGGVTIVQYREKESSTREMLQEAQLLHHITRKLNVPLIINDRVDIAVAIDAQGVHLGQNDMPLVTARKILGLKKIIGVSVKTTEQAQKAQQEGVDYLGVGDIFGTSTKKDAGKPIGLDVVRDIVESVQIPCVGIGGINEKNAQSVIKTGIAGIAVVSAIIGSKDPKNAAATLRSYL